jgi:hypothetical protein
MFARKGDTVKNLIVATAVALALAVPSPAHAGVKSVVKKAGHAVVVPVKKAAHVVGKGLLYVAIGAAVIAFCSQGACN